MTGFTHDFAAEALTPKCKAGIKKVVDNKDENNFFGKNKITDKTKKLSKNAQSYQQLNLGSTPKNATSTSKI